MNKNVVTNNNFSKIFDEATALYSDEVETPISDSIKNEADRYTQLKKHATGGHKVIYQCHDEYTDRTVALALPRDSCDHKKEEIFLREGRINSLLQHPNIIPIYDMGYRNGSPFFSMKFIQGKTLADIIEEGKTEKNIALDRNELIDIFLKVCDAIAFCHSKGIAHLDLKPENICIDEYGEVYVCDWGLAIILDDSIPLDESFPEVEKYSLNSIHEDKLTLDGYLKGTPGYMAPEQSPLMDEQKGIHSDIFSLGAILYTLLTYKKPFTAKTIELTLQKTVNGDFVSPSSFVNNLPAQLELICLQSLKVPLDQRYQSVDELKNDIQAFRNGYAISAEKNSNIKILSLLIKRNKALFLTVFIAFIIISLSTLFFTINLKKSEKHALALAEKFRLKTEESQERGGLLSNKLYGDALIHFEADNFDKAIDLLNYSLQLDANNLLAKELLGKLYFISEEYDQALNLLTDLEPKDKFSQFIINYSSKNQAPQTIDEFYQLNLIINKVFGSYNHHSSNLIHYKIYSDLNYQERLELASLLLPIYNKNHSINLKYDHESKLLDLSDNPNLLSPYMLQNFPAQKADFSHTSIVNFITFRSMPLLSLDVSSTPLTSLESFSNNSIRELYIANTKIRDLSSLRSSTLQVLDIRGLKLLNSRDLLHMSYLKTLITSPGQLDPDVKKLLSTRLKLIEKN
ncbi:protein kinase [Lentisphaera marina]|uniref:protein kinase domain-containing protein n=1 Tax=Lentisphaera marina TaxID=1111041 RepID=UPI002365F690|nr:protein kinase [Lentisphaera marina]MDD7986691.1 protein kinase [Lentisphaera marina]